MAWVQSLAWEILHAVGTARKKKKGKVTLKVFPNPSEPYFIDL